MEVKRPEIKTKFKSKDSFEHTNGPPFGWDNLSRTSRSAIDNEVSKLISEHLFVFEAGAH